MTLASLNPSNSLNLVKCVDLEQVKEYIDIHVVIKGIGSKNQRIFT